MAARRPAVIDPEGRIVGDARTVFQKLADWIGKQFPLSAHIERGGQLMVDRWAVMFYHADCSRCGEIIDDWPGAWDVESSGGRS